MICRTPAIVLRFSPVSETSRSVMWLSRDFGRIVTLVKGAQRAKSLFLGQFDQFQTCELLFYHREREGSYVTRECSALKSRILLREEWRRAMMASYLSDLLIRSTPMHTPLPEPYQFLDESLDILASPDAAPGPPFVFWCELRLLDILGLRPRLERCMTCGKPTEEILRHAVVSIARGGIFCRPCAITSRERTLPIHADSISILQAWQRAKSPRGAMATRITRRQLVAVSGFLGRFLRHHLDTRLLSRRIALRLVAGTPNELGLSAHGMRG